MGQATLRLAVGWRVRGGGGGGLRCEHIVGAGRGKVAAAVLCDLLAHSNFPASYKYRGAQVGRMCYVSLVGLERLQSRWSNPTFTC